MSLNRRLFLRALIGVPFAAKAMERLMANGIEQPKPVIEPVKPTVPPMRVPIGYSPSRFICSGIIDWGNLSFSGVSSRLDVSGAAFSYLE